MTLAISGRLGPNGWREVPALPFELAALPRGFYGALRLPVVSYALPALIAIGQAIHHHAPSRNPIARILRHWSRARTLDLLGQLQPANGGFLEATPLTAFVTMSLASAGNHDHPIAQRAAFFLSNSVREDGSWPIDTNLATWVSTLSVKALAAQPGALTPSQREALRKWLLNQQTQMVHPYTCAARGAWAWTDLPGGVPDADDTAGALTALYLLGEPDTATVRAAETGIEWLLNVANRDGGIPTFCPGWGTLPFDRSTPEITAHGLRAWNCWRSLVNAKLQARIDRATLKAFHFLQQNQGRDGSFIPLWFGNESAEEETNPVYGTAQVLTALNEIADAGILVPEELRPRAAAFLARGQKDCGGWGGDKNAPASIEETAVTIEALAHYSEHSTQVAGGAEWLLNQLEAEEWKRPAPIGLYFARLWYYERLYPLIFSVSALGKLKKG
jgi:squalene-hopene/tetraprenyl-beta-curcumene cyclase